MKVYTKNIPVEFTYPDEMAHILKYLNENGKIHVSAATIEELYYRFSDECYCAGWIRVDDERLEEFANWLDNIDI